jgi:N-acetylglucosaminyl-diphospho-decaprenol L-rhamnosyltransferase
VKVSAVLVSYNTKELTLKAISYLLRDFESVDSWEVILVDNDSKDGTVTAVQVAYPTVQIIQNHENVGFGKANNQAFGICRGKYVLLVNTDAFIHLGCSQVLTTFLDEHPDVAVVGPRVLNQDGSLQSSVHPFPTPLRCWIENLWLNPLVKNVFALRDWRSWTHDDIREVPWVIGACMLVRKSIIDSVGGFDERFFMYSEETDWQYRIRKAGWKIWFVHDAEVTHLGGASGGTESLNSKTRVAFFESLDYYVLKNHSWFGLLVFRAGMFLGSLLRVILWFLVLILRQSMRAQARYKVSHYVWLLCRLLAYSRPSRPFGATV